MARPIKATPVLKGKVRKDFLTTCLVPMNAKNP